MSTTIQPNKPNYVAKGAKIGAGVYLGASAAGFLSMVASVGKDVFVKGAEAVGGRGRYAAICALGLAFGAAIYAGIGAGIGKIVENVKAKKAQKVFSTEA